MSATESELRDPALVGEVDLARAAAQEEAADEEVGAHVGTHVEADTAVTHLFEAAKPGYRGWRWAVTVASAGPATDVTVSEVVLLPGPDALVAPDWIPWENRVKAGDLGVGDLLPTAPDDPRLVPAYVESDDPAVEEAALEVGLGRPRVMARPARLEAAARWQHSEFGPRSDMARSAPAHCGTCGFYLPLAGSLRAAFGTCGNEIAPADGHVVHAEYGCGAHSEAEVEQVSPVLVANLIYDDAQLDVAPLEEPAEAEAAAPPAEAPPAEAAPAEAATTEAAPAGATAGVTAEPTTADSAMTEADAAAEAALEAASPVAAAPARELPGQGQAAEPQLPFPDQQPPAAEPVAPLEAVVTAETSIDAPTEAGAPTQPDAEARSEAEPQGTTARAGTRTGGLLRGGLLKGGLLSGGLLRNRRAPSQTEAALDSEAASPPEAATETERQPQAPTQAEVAAPTDAASHLDAEGSTESERQPDGPAETEGSTVAEGPADSRTAPENEVAPTTEGPAEAAPEPTAAPEIEAALETDGEPTAEPTAATGAAQEHRPWEPSFRPYWMRSADERRTEGD